MMNNVEQSLFNQILGLVKMSDEKYDRVRVELRAAAEDKGEAVKNYVEKLLKLTDGMRGNKEESAATE